MAGMLDVLVGLVERGSVVDEVLNVLDEKFGLWLVWDWEDEEREGWPVGWGLNDEEGSESESGKAPSVGASQHREEDQRQTRPKAGRMRWTARKQGLEGVGEEIGWHTHGLNPPSRPVSLTLPCPATLPAGPSSGRSCQDEDRLSSRTPTDSLERRKSRMPSFRLLQPALDLLSPSPNPRPLPPSLSLPISSPPEAHRPTELKQEAVPL